jgi:hypothetical protein
MFDKSDYLCCVEDLKKQYEAVCNEYVNRFCEKQGLVFEDWGIGGPGGMCLCGDYFFNFMDIVWDINSEQPPGLILKWYDEMVDNPTEAVNYWAYARIEKESQKISGQPITLILRQPSVISDMVPTKRGCSNKTGCFCTGKCEEIIGYRKKIIGEN